MSHTISDSDDEPAPSALKPKLQKSSAAPQKRRTKEEIAADIEAKRLAREEREAQRMKQRAFKPGECLKFFEASVDVALVEHPQLGPAILGALRALNSLTVRLCKEPLIAFLPPGCGAIRWRRRSTPQGSDWKMEAHSLIIMTAPAFSSLTAGNQNLSLEELVMNIMQFYGPPPVVAVFGRLVTKTGRGRSDMAVPAAAFHRLAIGLQLRRGVCPHAFDSAEEMARLARCVTKAVAELDFRCGLRSSEAIFGPAGMNAPNIRISDKDPESFSKLWRQQLMQMRLVTGEVADAIVAQYRTPRLLAEAFERCGSKAEAVTLLADVEVRRGAGLLQTKRRVGKELARRLYELLTSADPEHVIR